MKLTQKEERWYKFADYYIASNNATESYKKVYKNCKKDDSARANASKLLTNANIIEYIEKKRLKMAEKREWTIERLIDEFAINHQMARGMKDVRGSNDSMKEIGKLLGHYEEKIRHSGEVNTNNPLKDLTAAELKKLIDK